jgi:hypothetical protein
MRAGAGPRQTPEVTQLLDPDQDRLESPPVQPEFPP